MTSALGKKRYSLLAMALLLLCLNGFALKVSVAIYPSQGTEPVSLYPFETTEYTLLITNNEPEKVENLVLDITVDKELAIVSGEKEVQNLQTTEKELLSGQTTEKKIVVKALEAGAQNFKITVTYGLEKFTHSASTYLTVKKNPIQFNARLDKVALNPEEEATVLLDIKNTSGKSLTDLTAQLIVPETIESLSEGLHLSILDSVQEIKNKEFKFKPKANVLGKRNFVLKINYSDETGFHSIEKSFEVDIRNRTEYLIIVALVVFALIVLSYYWKQKQQGPKIDTSKLEPAERETSKPE